MDQDQLFVISAINRVGIVEELNVYRDPEDEISADDPQLTDEFCQKFADKLHVLWLVGHIVLDEPEIEEYLEDEAGKFG